MILEYSHSDDNIPLGTVTSEIGSSVVGSMLVVERFELFDCVVVDDGLLLSGLFITPTNLKLLGGSRKSLQLVSPIGISWP